MSIQNDYRPQGCHNVSWADISADLKKLRGDIRALFSREHAPVERNDIADPVYTNPPNGFTPVQSKAVVTAPPVVNSPPVTDSPPVTNPPPVVNNAETVNNKDVTPNAPSSSTGTPPDGFASDWHSIRFSNTTNEPLKMHVTMAAGDGKPSGVDDNGDVTIPPGQSVDVTFPPNSHPNWKSTKGDGSVWNQGEAFFDEANHKIWFDMSYIYGANSNMRIFASDGQKTGYQGDLFANVPKDAAVGNWGVMAPYDRFHSSDDPNVIGSDAGGPDGAKNAGATYLYNTLKKGEGYVGRGKPVETTEYDDASSLGTSGSLSVVF